MKFYDLRKRLCEEKEIGGDLAEMNQSVPGEDSVQCTAFNSRPTLQSCHHLNLVSSQKVELQVVIAASFDIKS